MCNCNIYITGKRGEIYTMTLPVLEDKLINLDFDIFAGFCGMPLKECSKQAGYEISSRLSLYKHYKKNDAKSVKILHKYFSKYMIGFHCVDDYLYWGSRVISKEIFEMFCDYIAIALSVKSIDDLKYVITEDMDEFTKRQLIMDKKIAETKKKNQEKLNISFDLILTAISKEYNLTYQQLKQMTLYSIYYMYSTLSQITGYEIANIAAGNGLLKRSDKHNH